MSTNQTLQKKRDIRDLIQGDRIREQIALALPKHMTPDRMMRVALTTINRTPKLLECTPESLISSLMLCSQQSALISGHTSGVARTPASLFESSAPVLAEPSRTSGSHGEARGSKHKDRTIKGRTLAALLSISPTLTKPNETKQKETK